MNSMKSHTILLMQPTPRYESRSWTDFESVAECIEGVCKIFEENLKKLNPDSSSITYDVQNLFEFVDRLSDLSCLVWDAELVAYTAHNKEWIKEQIYSQLRKQAAQAQR